MTFFQTESVTFMKYFAILFNISTENFNLE